MNMLPDVDSLVLDTAARGRIEARIVRYGDPFGPGQGYVNRGSRPIVEFRRLGVSPRIAYVSSFVVDLFETVRLDIRFAPDGHSLQLALPTAEVRRLVAWLAELELVARDVNELRPEARVG